MRSALTAVRCVGAAAAVVVALAGCSSTASTPHTTATPTPAPVSAPTPNRTTAALCQPVMAALPTTVADLPQSNNEKYLRSYGNSDPITVACGVPKPASLDNTVSCDEVNGVGWYTENATWGYTFTTIGRAAYLQVRVPAAHSPAANALIDISAAVKKLPLLKPCV